jgi:hypothetical protein
MRQMYELNEGGGVQRVCEAHECPLHWPLFSQPDCVLETHDCGCAGLRIEVSAIQRPI